MRWWVYQSWSRERLVDAVVKVLVVGEDDMATDVVELCDG